MPEKNNISSIIAWNAWMPTFNTAHLTKTYIKYTINVKNVGILKYVYILSGDVVNDVIPSIARSINFT